MAGIQNGKFSCPECGKKYTWKPMLAGKKARCGCGVIMTVPQPEASPPEDPDGLDLSLFEDVESVPTVSAPRRQQMEESVPRRIAGDPTMHYAARPSAPVQTETSWSIVDPLRDLYIPGGIIAASFIALIAWAAMGNSLHADLGVVGFTVVLIVKLVCLVGVAILMAPTLDISFGTVLGTIMRLTAIIVACEVALLWLDVIFRATGGISADGKEPWDAIVVRLFFTFFFCAAASMWLLGLDVRDSVLLMIILSLVSRFIGFALVIIGLGGVKNFVAVVAPTPPPTIIHHVPIGVGPGGNLLFGSLPPPPLGADTTEPTVVAATNGIPTNDQEMLDDLKNSDPNIVTSAAFRNICNEPKAGSLVAVMRNEFAVETYATPAAILVGRNHLWGASMLYVQLPTSDPQRSACLAAYHKWRVDMKFPPDPTTVPSDQQFLIIKMPPPDVDQLPLNDN